MLCTELRPIRKDSDMATPQAQFAERRRYPRYMCNCGVEICTTGTESGYWGTLADICLGGCYVNTFSPLPAGTQVLVNFDAPAGKITLNGRTVTFHPGVGMGIEFVADASDEDARLRELIHSLAAEV